MNEKDFQKVMVVQEGVSLWMVALCRSGFKDEQDAMRWAMEKMNPQANDAELSVYEDAIRDALRGDNHSFE